jgi:uncharacterized protein
VQGPIIHNLTTFLHWLIYNGGVGMAMSIGLLTLHLLLPGCTSLKEKRSRLKPALSRLHREFNVSAAEIDKHDAWQEAVLACVVVSNDPKHNTSLLQKIVAYIEANFPDLNILNDHIELI